ncbi:hypothetical protein IAR55_002643 [Kwoniella newhampshirensis]|uniref:GH16 domain-containing protein n=1 Tax=Kwoniella newhampshirensis TaxID=1651941 RepID=A0AAW0YNK0_9TREE
MSYQTLPPKDFRPPRLPPKHPTHAMANPPAPTSTRRYGPSVTSSPANQHSPMLGGESTGGQRNKQAFSDPLGWGAGLSSDPEADDYLHNPDPKRDKKHDRGTIFTTRGLMNIGCLFMLVLCLITLFAGYPIITFYTENRLSTGGAYNLGGINSTGQIPLIQNFPTVIDPDTPQDVYTRTGFDGETYHLAFSDEFNKDGRTFFPGDDPYWTAVDIHYWPTGDFEWYDPSAITTRDGHLVITQTQEPIHDLNWKSGMLQSWNQMCFQYSIYFEISVSLPGNNHVSGFWPGVWMMGNLGRPGYGATTEGTWPYTYDSCDVGTLPNQTSPDGTGPIAALTSGANGGPISYIPRGEVSQSAQVAPFDFGYQYLNTTAGATQYDLTKTKWNSYKGGPYQEAVSSVTYIDNSVYRGTSGQFATYAFEMFSDPTDRSKGSITWVSEGVKSWVLNPAAIGPSEDMQIGQRLIAEEPMSMIINFGMSNNFSPVDFAHLIWPAEMLVDWVRVYQRSEGRMGCDPADRPTAAYIASHANAYNNPNLTNWADAGYTFPKNSLKDTC